MTRTIAYKSPEWWQARTTHVGGSDLGPILGRSPYADRETVLAEKLAGPRKATADMERGLRLEVGVVAVTAAEIAPQQPITYPDCIVDDRRYMASPDAAAGGYLIEAKTTTVRDAVTGWGRPSPDKYRPERVPETYLAQVQWTLLLGGWSTGYIGCLAAATDMSDDGSGSQQPRLNFAVYRIDEDPTLQRYLMAEADRFLAELDERRRQLA